MGPDGSVELDGGRTIEVRVSGPDDGPVLVFFHGTPGSRAEYRVIDHTAHRRGLRVVAASRPGYGASVRHAGRQVVDVVADTQAILRRLGVERCLVAGWSGGGPHALACAARLPGVTAALLIAGVAPSDADGLDWLAGMGEDNVEEFGAAAGGEAVLRPYLEAQAGAFAGIDAAGIVAAMGTVLPEVDRAVLTDEYGEDQAANFTEALRVGIDGWLDDDLAFVRPWGFDLGEIDVPVSLWQGTADLMVPFAHGRWLASHLPTARPHLLDGEGHLSIALGALDQMLDELVSLG